jgi:hypothetical protein
MARLHRAGRVRWWLVAVLALLALSVPPAVWFLCFRATPTATALLQVSMRQDTYLSNPPLSDSSGIQKEFDIYKSTQRGWLTSPFVLTTALRKPEIGNLAIIQREKPNEIAWVQDHLEVSFPGDAEVMQVDLTGGDPEEAVILLRAVVDAYLNEIVNSERAERNRKYAEVCQVYREKEEEMRRKSAALFMLAAALGTPDAETLSLQQKFDLEEMSAHRQVLLEARSYLWRLKSELAGQQAMLKGVESIGVDDPEVREAIDNDPLVRQLTDGLAVSKQSYKPDQKGELEARLDSRRAALLAIVRSRQQTPVVAQIRRLEATIDVAAQRQKELEQGVNETQKEVDKPGRSSVEVEMARAEVKNLEAALARLATEKENLGFELRGRPRVRLRQPAEVPEP